MIDNMSKISAADVNKLRKATGAGMMDCKKALVEAEGDFDTAVEVLRKKGQKVAANRADRDSSEGAVIARVNDDATVGVIVSVNCETDFVAKNESYVTLANQLADVALAHDSIDSFLAADFNGMSVADKLTEQTGVIGEKIEIGGFERLEGAFVGSYIHAGNKIATLTSLSAGVDGAAEAAKNVAMQAAAMAPVALNEDSIPADLIEKEKAIGKELAIQEGKPEEMADRIAEGRLKKWFKEATLVNQAFIKDSKVNVAQYVQSLNGEATVTGFCREALD